MDTKLLQEIKEQLLAKRQNLLKSSKRTADITEKEVGDSIDNAFDSAEREAIFEATNNDRNMITEIDNALQKIENGKFGICEECGAIISDARLKVLPTSRLCINCQGKTEIKK